MFGSHSSNRQIICSDEIGGKSAKSTIDKNVRPFLFLNTPEALNGPLGRSNEQYVKPPSQHLSNFLLLQIGILLGRGNDQSISARSEHRRNTLGHLCKKRMHKIRDN